MLFDKRLMRKPVTNIQVTYDANPNNDRSESILVANPGDASNMVGASKRFTDPAAYKFSLAAYATFDRGKTWLVIDNLALPMASSGVAVVGTSDPAVAWDDSGNAFLVGLPFPDPSTGIDTLGICVYKSANGGKTWGVPVMIHESHGDDKQSAAGDGYFGSPHQGNVYIVWDDGSTLRFARSLDHGASWIGVGANAAGHGFDGLVTDSFAPDVCVAPTGNVYIFWINGEEFGTIIKYVVSTDGGATFSAPAAAVTGMTPLTHPPLPQPGSFPELAGGKFRILTLASACAGPGDNLMVTWADYREGRSRIYFRHSSNGGTNWDGPNTGQPLLKAQIATDPTLHDFHPQVAINSDGEIGCAFYEFGPRGPNGTLPNLIDVVLAASLDSGSSFEQRLTVTDRPWDPGVDAPLSHGDPTTTFIGEYFGLAASDNSWFPFWTDTRTGIQELFTSQVFEFIPIPRQPENWAQILFGIINDAGGVQIVGGHLQPVPPRGPEIGMLTSILIGELARNIPGAEGAEVRAAAMRSLAEMAGKEAKLSSHATSVEASNGKRLKTRGHDAVSKGTIARRG